METGEKESRGNIGPKIYLDNHVEMFIIGWILLEAPLKELRWKGVVLM